MKKFLKKIGRKGKVLIGSAVVVVSSLAMSVVSFAEETSSETTVSSALTSGLTTVANDMKSTIISLIPVCLIVVGAVLVVTFGIKIFKKFTGR